MAEIVLLPGRELKHLCPTCGSGMNARSGTSTKITLVCDKPLCGTIERITIARDDKPPAAAPG